MGIELYWDNEAQTVLLVEINGPWTWDELHKVIRKVKQLTDAADYEVGAILDASRGLHVSASMLFSPSGLENAGKLMSLGDGGTGPVVIVGANSLIKSTYESLRGMNRRAMENVNFADTLEQARAWMERRLLSTAV